MIHAREPCRLAGSMLSRQSPTWRNETGGTEPLPATRKPDGDAALGDSPKFPPLRLESQQAVEPIVARTASGATFYEADHNVETVLCLIDRTTAVA